MIALAACGQTTNNGRIEQPLGFEEYDPVSTLKVAEHKVTRSKFPFIDVHNHQYSMASQDLSKLVADMDALNMGVLVNLSGRGFSQQWEDGTSNITGAIANVRKNYPKRFMVLLIPNSRALAHQAMGNERQNKSEDDVKAGSWV